MSRDLNRHHTRRVIAKRKKQIEQLGGYTKADHYLDKTNGLTCGDSNCAMCGNPRKFYGQKTIQERKFDQEDY